MFLSPLVLAINAVTFFKTSLFLLCIDILFVEILLRARLCFSIWDSYLCKHYYVREANLVLFYNDNILLITVVHLQCSSSTLICVAVILS